MTDTKLLRKKIESSGYRFGFIAGKVGITRQTLLKKVNNEGVFNVNEVQALHDLLGLTLEERDSIFFAR